MRSHSTSVVHRPAERGVALVLTLSILALVTLLLIAFVTSMRVENAASKNFNEVIKARELAQAGVDEAVGVIRLAAPPVSTLTNYVTAPGVIYTWANGTWTSNSLFTSVNLNDPNSLSAKTVNLNTNFVITGSGTVYNVANAPNSQLWGGWSNVVATANGTPQLVGRYAYWVDDESAKVNLNTAGMRTDDPQGLTPGAIDLGNLGTYSFSSAEVVSLTNYVHYTRPLDTIQSMVMAAPPLVGVGLYPAPSVTGLTFSNTQFYVTAHATSPDITPWGTQRINLNTLGINGTSAPSMAQKLAAVGTISTALSTNTLSTWLVGQTFASKYSQANEIQQIAANIVDYISTDNYPTDPGGGPNDTSQPAYLGLKETPYLYQLAVANTFTITPPPGQPLPTPGQLIVSTTISARLWYMYNSGGWNPAYTPWVYVGTPVVTLSGGVSGSITFNTAAISTGFNPMPPSTYNNADTVCTAPSFLLVPITSQQTFTMNNVNTAVAASRNSGNVTSIFANTQGRIDWAQAPIAASASTVASGGSLTWASQCSNDPRIKPSLNWGAVNYSQFVSPPASISPNLQQGNGGTIIGDYDMSCHIFSANTGTTGRQRGQMCPSELAYIHTGIPWRTLFLEPEPSAEAGAGLVPDWLAVDLFSAPSITNVDVPGRMSINAAVNNVVGASGTLLARLAPLDALLGSSYMTEAANIYSFSVHNTPTAAAFVQLPNKAFTTAGQVCEVQGLADAGYVNGYGNALKTTREGGAQAILNLVTPRSNTFTIWCVAQSVKKVDKTPGNLAYFTPGVDVVTGEAKVQAIVERTVDNSSGTPQVKFRTLYYRYLYQ